MNTEQLEYVIEIYRSKSINKAAKSLYVSQPTLSNALKQLEAELGYQIFERTSTGIKPTSQGEAFLRFAERSYSEYNNMRRTPNPVLEDEALSITAAFSSFMSWVYFEFTREHPTTGHKTDIFLEASIYPALHNVITYQTRLAFSYYNCSMKGKYEMYAQKNDLNLYVLKEALPICVVVPLGHPLAEKEAVLFDELKRHPYVCYHDVDFEDDLGIVTPESVDVLHVSNRASFYDAVRVGGYISTSLGFAPGEEERNGCVCKPCPDYGDTYTAAAFAQARYVLSAREKEYINYLKAKLHSVNLGPGG